MPYLLSCQWLPQGDIIEEEEQVIFEGAQEIHMNAQLGQAKTQLHLMILIVV